MGISLVADMSVPKISVLLPVYNAERYVGEAVDSILKQTFSDFEFIIINDGSTDQSLQILQDYARQDARIRLISRENRGLVSTLNEGLAMAEAPFIARMDADDVALPERFEKQHAHLMDNAACLAVGGRTLVIDPEGDPLCIWNKFSAHDEVLNEHLNTINGSAVCHPAVMFRADTVKALGNYRADYYPAEDLDLFLRISGLGRVENLTDVILKYRIHDKSICYTEYEKQKQMVLDIVNNARLERQMPKLNKTIAKRKDESLARRHLAWGWWALNSGFHKTARKYALRHLISVPFSVDTWRFIACVLRGH